MSVVPEYRLLNEFAETFRGKVYRHRNSNIGNLIAIELYEDLYALGKSRKLVERIDQKQCTINVEGKLTGVSLRRADGTFGERNPSIPAVEVADHAVARSHLATVEIGIEVKIISKAMIKQVDRVQGDLEKQTRNFRHGGGNPVSVGIVGINHAERYTSFEKDRTFTTTGRGGYKHPAQEADETERRLNQHVRRHYDEFLILHYKATNESPYPFEWVDEANTLAEYGAILTRISRKYDDRF